MKEEKGFLSYSHVLIYWNLTVISYSKVNIEL